MPIMTKKRKDRLDFLAMWGSEGLECLFDLSVWKEADDLWSKTDIWDVLTERPRSPRPTIPLQQMILRAKVNFQRNCEIYTFTAQDGITADDIRDLFETNPQFIVDFIRKNGDKVYSDYPPNKKVIS